MSRKEQVVAAIRLLIAAAGTVRRLPPAVNSLRWGLPAERLSRAAAQARRGLAERVLAGVLLAVAVTGAVLIPRLLVGPSPQHELGVGAPSVTGPPVVLAPGLPAQKSQPQAAAGLQSHATHVGVVPSASTSSQPTAQELPATSPAARRPPAAQPQPQPQAQPTIHALTPAALAPGAPTCNGTYSGTGKDVVVPSGATCTDGGNRAGHDLVVAGNAHAVALAGKSARHDLRIDGAAPTPHAPPPPHPVRTPKPPKPHEPKPPAPPKPQDKPKPHSVPEPKQHPDHAKPAHDPPPPKPHLDHPKSAQVPPPPKPHPDHPKHPDHVKPQHTPPPEPSQEAEPHGHGNGHKQ